MTKIIYVEGFDMPLSCSACPLHFMYPGDISYNCKLKFGLWNENGEKTRHGRCPLKEKVFPGKKDGIKYKILQQATGK